MEPISQILKDINRRGRLYREEHLAPLGINTRYAVYLREIAAEPGISQEQLARRICVNKSNVARNAAAMEEDGLIQRQSCGKDKRVLRLYLTEKAEALLPGINEVMDSWDALLVAGLTPQQQQLLAQLMSQMRTSITNTIEEG